MYTLYYSKKEKVIRVSKAKKHLQYLTYTKDITVFNDVYMLCSERKPLVEKANEIKQGWITELEENLKALKEIEF